MFHVDCCYYQVIFVEGKKFVFGFLLRIYWKYKKMQNEF